jgi:hypothetical protein
LSIYLGRKMNSAKIFPFFLIFILSGQLMAQQKLTISGTVHDSGNGESLLGATIYVKEISGGTITNLYGFYSLSLNPGAYTIEYRYMGYVAEEKTIDLQKDMELNVELNPEQKQLREVVVEGEGPRQNVTSVSMSTNKLDIKTIEKLPPFLGEADVLKSIQLLPGVSTVGEGASGFNVRGGSVGQNLIILDEAPVYNSSHMLGFFSVFNPDAVKDVKLYKGGIPAQYGGRISSILDIRMKEGNNKRFAANGGIGTIFSRLTVEAPLIKNRSSFIISARRSYADVLFRPFVEVLQSGAGLYFYDLTMKANYNLNNKDQVFLSAYLGRDVFRFDKRQGFDWGNKTTSLRWNHLFTQHLFMNLTSYFTDYDYSIAFGENDLDKFVWKSRIQTYSVKPDFSAFYGINNVVNFGANVLYYHFFPANAYGVSNGEETNISLENKYALESAVYVSNEQEIGEKLTLQYGLRATQFNNMGPGTVYTYETIEPGKRKVVVDSYVAGKNETIQKYFNLEPRASFKYQLSSNASVKASFNRMSQYVHLISNTTASNPLDVWTPSTNNIKPEIGDQYTAGYFRNFKNNDYEASVEGYYKSTQNQVDYIDGANLFINKYLEGELLSGMGRAYGLEFYLKKNTGKLNGWISYTIGRTEMKVDGINNYKWYPARYDQTHNLKIAAFYDLNERWSFSANFFFLSGTPTTFPTSRFIVQNYLIPYNGYGSRNNIRIPDYHRLDLAATLYGKKLNRKGQKRKNEDYWVFSVYNVYAHKNPFSIYFSQVFDQNNQGAPPETVAKQVSIIGTIVPSISYNFKF